MKYEQLIHQTLHHWVNTLEIDGETGESIVTSEDLYRLRQQLSKDIEHLVYKILVEKRLSEFIHKCFGHFLHRFKRHGVSTKFCPPFNLR